MTGLDTVIFDIGGVLTDFPRQTFFMRKGYDAETAARLLRATMESSAWEEYDRGVLSEEEVREFFKKNAPELAAEIDASLTDMTGIVTERDTAIPWVQSVKDRGCRALVLSNFSYPALRGCRESALGFLDRVDGGILSCYEHVIKPDPLIYALLIRRYSIEPSRAVFIDDTPRNLTAAARFGLRTILYRTQEQAEKELDAMLIEK